MKEVREIPREHALPWILEKHYAHRVPSISWAFGLYIDGVLVGVVTYGMPASPSLVAGVCGKENADKVVELNRLCMNDGLPKNSASYLVSRSLRLLPTPKIVVSYADTGQGHIGYIYQACNFLYTGITVARTDIDTGDKHSRHYEKGGDYSKRKVRHQKHRYVYFVGCDNETKNALRYKVESYPKGETKRYDSGGEVKTNGVLF